MKPLVKHPPKNDIPHGNQKGSHKRDRLCGGPWVRKDVLDTFHNWQEQGVPYGTAIDRLHDHAKETGFCPAKRTRRGKS